MKKTKRIALVLALAMALAQVLSGCANETKTQSGENATLRYWMYLTSYASNVVSNMGETPMMKEAQRLTGINVEFEHPPQGQIREKFNVMVASDNLPDIIQYNWENNYPGGPQKAIDDRIIVDLNELKSSAPNLFKFLDENEEVRSLSTTDDGQQFAFPFVRLDMGLRVSQGVIVRKDWLDDVGLGVPETIDEWETALTAFRDKKGATAPLSVSLADMQDGTSFIGAYNTMLGYYVEDGKVKHGYLEPGLKDWLITMNRWYSEKLLDQDFASLDTNIKDANILNGNSGAVVNSIGRGIGRYMNAAPDEKYQLVGAKYPVLNKGETPKFSKLHRVVPPGYNAYAAISIDCQNKELAAKFLDFGYSDEGRTLYNFGIEGESFNMIDGYPTYSEKITKNPDGLSMTEALALYTYAYDYGPTIQDVRYMEQYAATPEQKQAWETWSITEMDKRLAPALQVKVDELSEHANLDTAVVTYADEMMYKIIMGVEPVEKIDEMVAQIKARGMDRLLEMKQASYDRYISKNK